ncbi:hypothetical protein DRQ33_06050 [bacterium]|nr:MAG: hypothetical protein DRQ33_06050 [bacterium]
MVIYKGLLQKSALFLIGKIVDGKFVLNEFGEIVRNTWFDLQNHIDNVELDEFIIMPNHFH